MNKDNLLKQPDIYFITAFVFELAAVWLGQAAGANYTCPDTVSPDLSSFIIASSLGLLLAVVGAVVSNVGRKQKSIFIPCIFIFGCAGIGLFGYLLATFHFCF